MSNKVNTEVISGVILALLSTTILAADFAIEEIVVTAQKRAQSVNDIGVTVTTFDGDDITELGLDNPSAIAAFTPGLSTSDSTSTGMPIFAIRGIGLDDFNSNNTSGVGVYIDEVYAPYPVFLNGQLFDMERVEVLKGPQGTLYGKNSTGGAINYVSVRPTDEFEGYLKIGYSRWDTFTAEGAVSGAFSDGIRSRLSGKFAYGDEWQQDIVTLDKLGGTDKYSLRWLTDIDISDNVNLLLNLHYSKDDSEPLSPQNLTIDSVFGIPPGILGVVTGNPRDVQAGGFNVFRDEEGFGVSGILTIDFDAFTLTSITAYDRYTRDIGDNLDGTSAENADFTFDDEVEAFSQELRLTSNTDGRVSWVVGLTYSDDEVDAENTIFLTDFFDGILNFFAGTPIGTITSFRNLADSVQDTRSIGAYLHTETSVTDQLNLTLGLRYSNDKREFVGTSTDLDGWQAVIGGFSFVPIPGLVLASLDQSETDEEISWKVGLDYDLNEDWLLYASVATSYKAGVYYGSPVPDQAAWAYIPPEEVIAYEVGFKGSLVENTVQLNGAYYHYVYDDRQSLMTAINQFGGIFVTLGNVPKSKIDGAELELRWLPIRGLDIRAAVSYIDARVTEGLTTVRGETLLAPIPDGQTLAQAPEWSFSAVGRYEWEVGELLAAAQLSYSWTDEQLGVLADTQANYGEIENLGLRLNVRSVDQNWNVAFWVENLQDNDKSTYAFTSIEGGRSILPQLPRNYGVELSYSF